MKSSEIRARFLRFFETREHRVVPSSSLVPANDPTLLFANAGMNQFKDVFLGREKRDYRRAASSQKCVRAGGKHNDLEQVGRTTRHHTFFEMLGNFSFGDYFKKDAIPWAWELITKDYGIPPAKLYATVFREDDEAEELWAKIVPRERIFRFDEKDNFWAMGETGPCGPCSELHYDMGPGASDLGHKDCAFGCDCGRYVELWNLVFMQFNRDEQGQMTPLPRPSIDTGAGLERLAAVLQGKLSNFDTDLFQPLIEEAASLANVEYGANHDTDVSLRIIADHARSATFLISDGVLPSNEGRGYVLRLIMRRALYHGQTLGLNEPFLFKMSGHVVQMMKDAYPDLVEHEHHIAKAIKIEEEKYAHTTRVALSRLESEPVAVDDATRMTFAEARAAVRAGRELGALGDQIRETFEAWQRKASSQTQEIQQAFEAANRLAMPAEGIRKAFETAQEVGTAHAEQMRRALEAVAKLASPAQEIRRAFEAAQKVSAAHAEEMRKTFGSIQRLVPPSDVVQRAVLAAQEFETLSDRMRKALEKAQLQGDALFKLHDTYGLRPDFAEDILRNHGIGVDREGYEAEMEKQRERARASWKGIEKKAAAPIYQQLADKAKTLFDGYAQTTSSDCRIVALIQKGETITEAKPGAEIEMALDHTPFYAEAGGQVGDTGFFFSPGSDHELAHVTDTHRPVSGLIVHKAVARDTLRVGDTVIAVVDPERRDSIRRNHTATHLLHAALRTTLGTHVKQAGSLVAPDRLRFDFSHFAPLDAQDLLDIEDLVNEHILKNEEVVTTEMDLDTAVNSGAMALFGEKYADKVRVLTINDFSKELCGGTHVRRTGDIGLFKVISEGSVAAGTRRIEALTGEGVLKQLREASETLALLSESLRAKPDELLQAAEKLTETEKKLRKELEAQQMKRAASQAEELAGQAREVKGVRVLAARVDALERAALRQMVDELRVKLGSGVIVLGGIADGKVALIAAVTKDLTSKLDAGKIVKQAAALVEGSGGGRKDLAEAGGKNPAKLDESLQAIPAIIEKML